MTSSRCVSAGAASASLTSCADHDGELSTLSALLLINLGIFDLKF